MCLEREKKMTNSNFGDGGFSRGSRARWGGSVQVFATMMHMEVEQEPRVILSKGSLNLIIPSMNDNGWFGKHT